MEHWAEQRIGGKIKALVDRMEWKWGVKRTRSQGDLPDLWLTQDGDVGQAAEIGKKSTSLPLLISATRCPPSFLEADANSRCPGCQGACLFRRPNVPSLEEA